MHFVLSSAFLTVIHIQTSFLANKYTISFQWPQSLPLSHQTKNHFLNYILTVKRVGYFRLLVFIQYKKIFAHFQLLPLHKHTQEGNCQVKMYAILKLERPIVKLTPSQTFCTIYLPPYGFFREISFPRILSKTGYYYSHLLLIQQVKIVYFFMISKKSKHFLKLYW